MEKYTVTLEETIFYTVEGIEASSEEEARQKVVGAFMDGELEEDGSKINTTVKEGK